MEPALSDFGMHENVPSTYTSKTKRLLRKPRKIVAYFMRHPVEELSVFCAL